MAGVPFPEEKTYWKKLLKEMLQIEVRLQIIPGILTHFPEEGSTLLHGEAAAQGLVQEGGENDGKIPGFDAFVDSIDIDAVLIYQIGRCGGQGIGHHRLDLSVGEHAVGLHDAAQGQLGHLALVG